MKTYTDILQSKKLAEFLPIESADGTWKRIVIAGCNLGVPEEQQYFHDGDTAFVFYSGIGIPSWSLAALLEIIPNWTMDKTDKINLTCNPYYHCESCYEDPLDAAFEMVCWLKENGKI